MADTIKILGQVNPLATTDTTVYTVPDNTSTVISTIWVVEIAGGTPTFRIAVLPKGAEVESKNYLHFDKALTERQTLRTGGGITLAQGDEVMVRSSDTNVAFSVFGVETTREER